MRYRNVGKSGLKVSEVALGSWLTYGGSVAEESAITCVRRAFELGVNYFDTADAYARGEAEKVLRKALEPFPRHHLVIATKAFWPQSDDPNDRGLSRKHIMESLHASLRRLQTDYVDLYQAHRYDVETPLEETLRAFDDLVRQGKVHYVGVSEWTAEQIESALQIADDMGFDRLVSNQPEYSLLWRVIEAEVVPLCEREGIGQIVWSPLAQGVLTGKYRPGEPPPAGSRATTANGSGFISDLLTDEVLEPVQEFAALARSAGHSPAAVALAWVLTNPNVSAAIVGATRPEQLQENVKALDVELEPELLLAIEEMLNPVVKRDPALTQSPPGRP